MVKNKKTKKRIQARNGSDPYLPAVYQKLPAVAPANGSSVRSTSQLKQQLSDLCIDIYMSGGQRFIPMPPFVLVRVLPKDLISDGGIILPNQQQNKPVHEGIVLETYRPYEEQVVLRDRWADGSYDEHVDTIIRTCPLKQGQRVAYPHYEGVPHKYLGEDYMLIRHSADQIKFPYCQVLGIIEYDGDRNLAAQIKKIMRKFHSVTTSGTAESIAK
jgi:co-chaperonin GroES (HSP10)